MTASICRQYMKMCLYSIEMYFN